MIHEEELKRSDFLLWYSITYNYFRYDYTKKENIHKPEDPYIYLYIRIFFKEL